MGSVRITVDWSPTGYWELCVDGSALVRSSRRNVLVAHAQSLRDSLLADGRTIEAEVLDNDSNVIDFRSRHRRARESQ